MIKETINMKKEELLKRRQELLKHFEVQTKPEGWKVDKYALTAPIGYVWIYNGKGYFSGRQHALIKIENL